MTERVEQQLLKKLAGSLVSKRKKLKTSQFF